MAISVDWGSRVIFVPQADLTPIGPSTFELDLNWFRLQLKDLEDDEAGMAFPRTHENFPEVLVGGITLARVIEIINGYTVTFEDGQYGVNCVGANSNIADVLNRNQVSVGTANSAGLIVRSETQLVPALTPTQETMLLEMYRLLGLDPTRPLVVGPSSRRVPADGSDIDQTVVESAGVVTVTRQ